MTRRGWTFVELMIVIVIVGVLTNIAIPKLSNMRRRAEAARVIGDFRAVRTAAFDRFAADGTFPPSGAWGDVPPELAVSLPQGFTFDHGELVYRWRRWSLPDGMPQQKDQTVLLGFEVRTSDSRLMQSIKGLYTGPLAFGDATSVTLVIE